jgi:hypothetical protein
MEMWNNLVFPIPSVIFSEGGNGITNARVFSLSGSIDWKKCNLKRRT